MKNVFVGTLLIFSTSLFGQNLTSASSVKKVIRTVTTFDKPVEVKKIAETTKNKTYAYLTRIVTTIPEEEFKKRKGLN